MQHEPNESLHPLIQRAHLSATSNACRSAFNWFAALDLGKGEATMCDYSLMSLPNRLAVCGEQLVVHRFEFGSMGLVSELDLQHAREIVPIKPGFLEKLKRTLFPGVSHQCPAVCIPPGAQLLVRDIPPQLGLALGLDSPTQHVVFTQIGTSGYRDAFRFRNGVELLLQKLQEGQRVRVLALSAEDQNHDPVVEFESPHTSRNL